MAENTIPIAAELILKGEKWAAELNKQYGSAKNFSSSVQREIDRINGTKAARQFKILEQAIKSAGGVEALNAVQVENLRVRIEGLARTGATVPASLANIGKAADGAASGTTRMADSVGKISTTLARSVGVLGLPAEAFRAIDDAADIAELGLRGMAGGLNATVTSANAFSAGTLGAVGAAAALGIGIGTLIRQIPGVAKALDGATQSLYNWIAGVDTAKLAAGPAGFDQKAIAAGQVEAIKAQIQGQLAAGVALKDLTRLYKDAPKAIQAYLKELDKEADANEKAQKAVDQHRQEIERLASSLSGGDIEKQLSDMAEALASGIRLTDAGKQQISETVGKAMAEGLVIPASLIPIQQEVVAKQLQEIIDGAIAKTQLKTGTGEGLWDKLLGGDKGIRGTAAVDEVFDRAVAGNQAIQDGLEDNVAATFDWAQQLEDVANLAESLPGFFGRAFSSILAGVSGIGASLKNIGGLKGLGKSLTGGAGLGGIFAGAGVIGTAISAGIGIFKGIFGDSKKKAEELKKKQTEATDAFTSAFDQWKQAAHDLAATGAEGVNNIIGSLFDENGKFTGQFTSAANAAEYVAASFGALIQAGYSTAEALAAIGPALDQILKDPKAFSGSAAAPLIQLAGFAKANEKLLQFVDGLGQTASALAGFGLLTQDLADKIGKDLSNSIDKMIAGGLSESQALALSAQSLYDLQQAALANNVTLDAHTQKLIDDAEAAGLFKNLEDPMKQVVEATQATAVAMASLVQLMGGQLSPALQHLIDEFNSAQINTGSASTSTSGGATGGTGFEGPHFQTGGIFHGPPEGGLAWLHNNERVLPPGQVGIGEIHYSPVIHINGSGLSEQQLLRVATRAVQTGEGGLRTAIIQAQKGGA